MSRVTPSSVSRVTCPVLSHCIQSHSFVTPRTGHLGTGGQKAGAGEKTVNNIQQPPLGTRVSPCLSSSRMRTSIIGTNICLLNYPYLTISLAPSVSRFPRAQVSSEPQPPVTAPASAEEETLGGVPAQLPQRHQHPGCVDISGADVYLV